MLDDSYNSSSIKVLKGLEAVRKRPGMYIGDTSDDTGLHNMVFEIIDNSVDESLCGFCKNITVKIHKDNSISVLDDGRGIPVDLHKEFNISSAELIMTVLHAGGKFDNNSYNISSGLHGVGISVVNALSERLDLYIYKFNKIYYQTYSYGKANCELKEIGKTKCNGTYIRFWPDKNIFINFKKFNYNILFNRLHQLSFLNRGLNIILIDNKNKKNNNFINYGGIKSYLNFLINKKNILNKNIFYIKIKKKKIILEFVCQWVDVLNNKILCFTNNIYQSDGGAHLSGLKSGITRAINNYLNNEINIKKNNLNIIGDDTREGLYAILSIKMFNPKFSSQTKEKLISSEIKFIVESLINKNLFKFLLENPNDSKLIIKKIINSFKYRESLRKFKELSKKKINLDLSLIANKLADCQLKKSNLTEIFLVEGDSAGGSAKQSRNRKYQAVLPLKGKIINVEKMNLDKILFSKEINLLISVLGCGIKNRNFNIKKLRYNNIIIMTDADIDGAHIRTLLLTFFYRYMPDLINFGHLYIARPPLYRIKYKKKEYYLYNYKDLIKYKIKLYFKNINLYINNNLIINSKKLINLIIIYNNILDLFFKNNNNNKLYTFILDILIFFSKNTFNYFKDYSFWFNKFNIYLNNFFFNKKKIKCKLLKKNNIYFLKFKYNNFYINKILYINIKVIKDNYFKLLYLNKRLYFFNIENYIKKYIIYKNKKIYFNKFYELINYILSNSNKIFIQRYKGLGEMNPNQLWNTTMDPKNRNISNIYIEDAIKADYLFKTLMGDDIKLRKIFIKKNIKYIQ